MAKFIIQKEPSVVENKVRYVAYEICFDGYQRYIDKTMSMTAEECEKKLRELVDFAKTEQFGVSKELEL